MSITKNIQDIKAGLAAHVQLIAVSKTKPASDILAAYEGGQRLFGENKVQELCEKQAQLPSDIEWHMIGHLQSNKVKYIAPFVSLIHGVDSLKLLKEIQKQAAKHNRTIDCLLQVHIAQEAHKFGFSEVELLEALSAAKELPNICVIGLMGMATFTNDEAQVSAEFSSLKQLFDQLKEEHQLHTLSMGMSGDYLLAVKEGSTMVRIGSAIFGHRH
jgi:pyridoxal phosphate enzyme (YggS family)